MVAGTQTGQVILLFDGVCNSCNSVVNFILSCKNKSRFVFAPLQSDTGQHLLRRFQLPTSELETLVLIDGMQALTMSRAVFRILALLGFPWSLLTVFSVLPRFIADFCYRLYASNRYRLFGKRETCRILTREEQAHFLEPDRIIQKEQRL